LTSSFGIDGNFATTRSSFLALLGIRRLLGVRYAPHTELRTGSPRLERPKCARAVDSPSITHPIPSITHRFPSIAHLFPSITHQTNRQAVDLIEKHGTFSG
jgi:hypothetical protein